MDVVQADARHTDRPDFILIAVQRDTQYSPGVIVEATSIDYDEEGLDVMIVREVTKMFKFVVDMLQVIKLRGNRVLVLSEFSYLKFVIIVLAVDVVLDLVSFCYRQGDDMEDRNISIFTDAQRFAILIGPGDRLDG